MSSPAPTAERGRTSQEEAWGDGLLRCWWLGRWGREAQLNYGQHQGKSDRSQEDAPGGGEGCGQPPLTEPA